MSVKISDFEEIKNKVFWRKHLREILEGIESATEVTVGFPGVHRRNPFGSLGLFFKDDQNIKLVKDIARRECEDQIAEAERVLAKYGVEIEAGILCCA